MTQFLDKRSAMVMAVVVEMAFVCKLLGNGPNDSCIVEKYCAFLL